MKPKMLAWFLVPAFFLVSLPAPPAFADRPDYSPEAFDARNRELRENGPEMMFNDVARRVEQLLTDRDVTRFVEEMSPNETDVKRQRPEGSSLDDGAFDYLTHVRRVMERSAQRVVDLLRERDDEQEERKLRLVRVESQNSIGGTYPSWLPQDHIIPYLPRLRLIFTDDPPPQDGVREYEITLYELHEYPGGWRSRGSIRWSDLPLDWTTEEDRIAMRVLNKAAEIQDIDSDDDPGLRDFAENVCSYLFTRDESILPELVISWEDFHRIYERNMPDSHPPEEELRNRWNLFSKSSRDSLKEVAEEFAELGVEPGDDFTIDNVVAKRVQIPRGQEATLEDISTNAVKITFSQPFRSALDADEEDSGREVFILSLDSPVRRGGKWTLLAEQARWEALPERLLTEARRDEIAFENHVATHRALPAGTPAPDLELVGIADESPLRISDFQGKVVILEFWAVWCGPCHAPMTNLQTLLAERPEWEGKVEVVTLSIDEDIAVARHHLEDQEWTRTLNVWSGAGGWRSPAGEAFRVSSIPVMYVIDANGIIQYGGSAHAPRFDEIVEPLLP